jgi:DNA mismatch repair protein MutS2
MFQSGIPIPCDPDSTIPIFDSILVDIGDSQSIVDDLSTFSAHIVNVKAIIEELVKPDFCLVLLDELGVGSNPRQGGALACAILEHLHDSNVLTLITTHYEPLIALASKLPRANNCAVRFDPEKVKPLYQLEMGRSGISHSFKIARLYGMEDQILDRALSFLDDEEQRFIRLSEMLEMKEKALNVQQKQLELSEAKTEEMKKQFKEEVELLRKRREEARGEVVKELEKELSGRLAEMDELVGKARGDAEKMQRTSLRGELKRAVQKLRDEVLQVEKPIVVDKQVLFVGGKGDRVVYGDDLRGVVVEVTGKKRYRVEFENGLVMELAASALRADSKPAESGRVLVTVDRPMNVKTEIDLRGERLQEALEKVEKYLVEVHSARLTEVNIIHGKGTMRLSEGIKEYLTAHPMVASHRAGKWGEGDYGVTVVKMK